ncbi:MAG: HD domain-containing protein [Candidatus Cryptobacteroides sp.]|nr:HD domain-containing protein [Candidatus Cryptobacteroides sp.]MDY4562214.1 HD domain-containing protein [Candidatus Cryptobacteroides sp.]
MSSRVSEFTAQDYQLISREFAELRESAVRRCANQQEIDTVQKAFDFANEAHKGVRRRSGEPYIIHPIEVAKIVVNEIGLGCKSIVAALLHDVVEDTDYTVEDIRNLFGDKIATLVDGLTKIKTVLDNEDKSKVKSIQAENFKRILLTLNDDVRVVLIKLADRLHNCRTIEYMPEHKRDKILGETMFIFIPLAHRLGLYGIKSEMEDIWLRYKEPQAFNEIKAKINRNANDKEKQIDDFVKEISQILDKMDIDYEIRKRVKSPYSIWHKMRTKNVTFEQVFDLYAVRIIFKPRTENVKAERSQCYAIFSAITNEYDYREDRFRDWIKQPKNNGYEALHCTVMSKSGIWVEVQIRSRRMNDIAEKGIAAHWAYKREGIVSESESEMDKWIAKVQEILMNPDVNALELLDIIHNDLTASEIFVFTPKGEQKSILKGATALDFAYMIHTHIGNKAIAAKVNLRLEPLSYVLRSGDQIEIITAQNENPKREWLDFLKTRKAINIVKEYFDRLDRKNAAEAQANQKASSGSKWSLPFFKPKAKSEYIINDRRNTDNRFVIATCCHPIPGDPVIGFLSPDGVVTVHKKSCQVANTLAATSGDSIVVPKWEADEVNAFPARISVTGIDRVGLLNEITKYVSVIMKVNLRRLVFESQDSIFSGEMDLMVHEKADLERLLKMLQKIDGIQKVIRKNL